MIFYNYQSYNHDIKSYEHVSQQNHIKKSGSSQHVSSNNLQEQQNSNRSNQNNFSCQNPQQLVNAEQLYNYQGNLNKKNILSQQSQIMFQYPSRNNQNQNGRNANQVSEIRIIADRDMVENMMNTGDLKISNNINKIQQNGQSQQSFQVDQIQKQQLKNGLTNSIQQKINQFEVDNVNEKSDRLLINQTKSIQSKIESLNSNSDQLKIQFSYKSTAPQQGISSVLEGNKISPKNTQKNQNIINKSEKDKKMDFFNQQCEQHLNKKCLKNEQNNNILKDSKQINLFNRDPTNINSISSNTQKIISNDLFPNKNQSGDTLNMFTQKNQSHQQTIKQQQQEQYSQQDISNLNSKEQQNNLLINNPSSHMNNFKMNPLKFKNNPLQMLNETKIPKNYVEQASDFQSDINNNDGITLLKQNTQLQSNIIHQSPNVIPTSNFNNVIPQQKSVIPQQNNINTNSDKSYSNLQQNSLNIQQKNIFPIQSNDIQKQNKNIPLYNNISTQNNIHQQYSYPYSNSQQNKQTIQQPNNISSQDNNILQQNNNIPIQNKNHNDQSDYNLQQRNFIQQQNNNINIQSQNQNIQQQSNANKTSIDYKILSSASLQFVQELTQHQNQNQTQIINKIDLGKPIHRATKSIFDSSLIDQNSIKNRGKMSLHSHYDTNNSTYQNFTQNTETSTQMQYNLNNSLQQNDTQQFHSYFTKQDQRSMQQGQNQKQQPQKEQNNNNDQKQKIFQQQFQQQSQFQVQQQKQQQLQNQYSLNNQKEVNNQIQQKNSNSSSIYPKPQQIDNFIKQNSNNTNIHNQGIKQQQQQQDQQQKVDIDQKYFSNFESVAQEYNNQDEINNQLKEKQINQEINNNKQQNKKSAEKPQIHLNSNSKLPQKKAIDKQGNGINSHKLDIDLNQIDNQVNKIQVQQGQLKFPTPSHFDRDSSKSKRSSVQSHTGRSDNGSVNNEIMKTQQNNGSNHNVDSLNYEKISQQQDKSNFFDQLIVMSDNFLTKTQQFFQNNIKKINSRLGCSCDLNLKSDATCSKAYEWLFMNNTNKKEDLKYLKDQYENIKNSQVPDNEACVVQIEKDLSRTFPLLEMFQNEKYINSLRNVLQAVAKYEPTIGYVQGMNMIAASLLYHAEEYVSFWIMQEIFEKLEMYDIYKPSLPGLSKHIQLIDIITFTRLPDLYSHFTMLYTELLKEGWVMFYKLVIAFLCYNKEYLFEQDMGEMLMTLTQGNYKFESQEQWELLIKYSKNVDIDCNFINSMLSSYDSDKKQFKMKSR